MKVLSALTTVASILVSTPSPTEAALSIPSSTNSTRAAIVYATSQQISNVDRQFPVGDKYYPIIPGPTPMSSLYNKTVMSQLAKISTLDNKNVSIVGGVLQKMGPYKSLESFKAGYDALESAGLIDIPQALDNSDENFGAMRLGIRGYKIKLVNSNEWADPLNCLSSCLVREQCNEDTISAAISNHKVFVQDFSTIGQYTDTNQTASKYVPNVVGFFCNNNANGLLLPLAIKIVDTGLTYTKEDTAGEWQLAKMALDAAELSYQQMFHFVQMHAVAIPIQVEMMRSMAEEHPIYALLNYHFFGDLALETLAGKVLFSVDSPYDQSFAFGASGSLRFNYAQLNDTSFAKEIAKDFPAEIADNGLQYLPSHRYVKYGTTYYSIIKSFVTSYVNAYYSSNEAIRNDVELQTWLARVRVLGGRGSEVENEFRVSWGTEVPDPTDITSLIKLVTNFAFRSSVKHHFMNGRVSWHSIAAPFSTPALYNTRLPTQKGVRVNPFDYAIPSEKFPAVSALAVSFYRPMPATETVLRAYTTAPFSDEPVLEDAIAEYHLSMAAMEDTVDTTEAEEQYPDIFTKPSMLPWFTYI